MNVRTPPHSYDVEQALLGAILMNNRAYDAVAGFLRPDHFAHMAHARIYEAIGLLIERGKLASPLTLKATFDAGDDLKAVGGVGYLGSLICAATTISGAGDYGRHILDLAKRRAAIAAAEDLIARAHAVAPDQSADELLVDHDRIVVEIASQGQVGEGLTSIGQGLDVALARTEAAYKGGTGITGVPTGLTELDLRTGGLQPGNLVILGGRPSMGKTTLAANMMLNAARAGHGVGFFSLEMSKEEVGWVVLANMTGISVDSQKAGRVNGNDFDRLMTAGRDIRKLPFLIDDTPAQTVTALRAKARQLKRRGNLGLVVVDYLQLVASDSRRGNRTEDVSEISRGLKTLAKELHVPVLALSQLSRQVEMRENKRPVLADLRESGAIEQDADVVLFIYRDEYYLEREAPPAKAKTKAQQEARSLWEEALEGARNVAEIIIPKNRMGATGMVRAFYDASKSKFADLEHRRQYEESFL